MHSHIRALLIRETNAVSMKCHLPSNPKLRADTSGGNVRKLAEGNDSLSRLGALFANDRDRA